MSLLANVHDSERFDVLSEKYFNALSVHNCTQQTIASKRAQLKVFVDWCSVRDIHRPADLTQFIGEGYQKYLHCYRKDNGKPLSIGTQRLRMTAVKMFYRWLVQARYLMYSPLDAIDLPKLPKCLPKAVLSEVEVEKVLTQADLETATGLRDRAMMETLYSSGLRRAEVLNLNVNDLDRHRGWLRVNQGKGQKDRVIPIGERAVLWIERYLAESRPVLLRQISEPTLFVSHFGKRLSESTLTKRFAQYVRQAGVSQSGSVHIFRHTSATLMLENGADIRHIQAMLGHEDLSTTQIYTHVAITHLKDVHRKTHPAKLPGSGTENER